MGGHVGDVDPETKTALGPRRGHGVIEVMSARRVDREGGEIAKIPTIEGQIARGRGGVCCLTLDPVPESDPQVAVGEHRIDHVGGQSGIPELPNHPGTASALTEVHQRQPAGGGGAAPAADLDAAATLKEQLADEETAPLGDENDAPLGPRSWTPWGQSCPDST
jgi:hypothetical protein